VVVFVYLFVVSGCGDDEQSGRLWAAQHASVDVDSKGLSGYQVWEFYDAGQESDVDSDHHLCSMLQWVDGLVEDFPLDTAECEACILAVELDISLVSTDCDPAVSELKSLSNLTHFGFGPPVSELSGYLGDIPQEHIGWYLSWGGSEFVGHGFVWPTNDEVSSSVMMPVGEGITLWPGYLWRL